MNLVPSRYRSVAVTAAAVMLQEQSLREHFRQLPAYRRTRYIVVRAGEETAVVQVRKHSDEPLFSPITDVTLVASPTETAFVHAPETDTGVPSQLARVAATSAPAARCVVVQGRYQHVNFILDPAPIRLGVVEVVPPRPPKLYDQLSRVLDLAEELPPVELVPEVFDLADLARERPSSHYLLPCRGSGAQIDEATVSFLDEIPEPADWTLIGCARSRTIHEHFYGRDLPTVDMCPRTLLSRVDPADSSAVLAKCCLLEDRIEQQGQAVIVPWGASLAEIREGLAAAVDIALTETAAHPA